MDFRRSKYKYIISLVLLFIVFLFYWSFSKAAITRIDVTTFGANGLDETEDTLQIQEAINSQTRNEETSVYFPKGRYLIDATQSIKLNDNTTLEFEKGTVLQALPNKEENYEIIRVHDVENISIKGEVEIIGERDKHIGKSGEWGMGISIRGASNVKVEDVSISNCWGDGIYLGSTTKQNYNHNIRISNVKIDGNRRQGISIISAKNLEIKNARITNTNGTPPEGGIDIEPNNNTEYLENVKILNLYTEKNKGSGLYVSLGKLKGSVKPINIFVNNINNIKDGIKVTGEKDLKGTIEIAGKFYLSENNFSDLNSVHWAFNEITYLTNLKVIEGFPNKSFKPDTNITRAEAAKLLSSTLNLAVSNSLRNYKDVKTTHWARNAIESATAAGLFSGYPNGNFNPEQNLTRAEMAKILTVAYKLQGNSNHQFKDVSTSHWATKHISVLTEHKITTGFPDKTFQPDASTTRAQFSVFLARAMDQKYR